MGKHKKGGKLMENSTEKKDSTTKGFLSPQKRNEANEIVKKLLKLTSQIHSDKTANWSNHIEIDKLLRKVQEIEPVFDINKKREIYFPALIKWIKENGGITENISIRKFDNVDYGLEAVNEISEGGLICAIPKQVMMTLENVEDSPLKHLFSNDPILKNMGNIALALFLILEYLKGEQSFWHSYISSLPTQYNTVLYFNVDDFSELKCSPTFEPAIKHYKNIARQYAYFNNLFQSSNDEASQILRNAFTYQLYRWAVSTVMTRQNFVPSKDKIRMNGLIPLWDMCNHGSGYLSTQYKEDRSECLACKTFKKGEQVFIYYGDRSNSDFFLHNGFTYEDNDRDSFRFFLGVSKSDKLHDERSLLLERLDVPVSGHFYIISGSEIVDDRLLAFLRIFNMDSGDLDDWKSSDHLSDLMYKDCALDTKLETKVWNFLFDRIKLLLMSYGKIVEDEDDSSVSDCRRLVRRQLRLEKRFLERALEQVRRRIRT